MPQEYVQACPILRDTSFTHLMMRRICNVLIIANPYDAFMLEDDGRVDEKIFDEYAKLGLRFPPRFFQVASAEEAEAELQRTSFDLVICMPGAEDNDVFCIARDIKQRFPQVPLIVLTPFSHGITQRMQNEDLSIFEYVFCWLGNTDLLLSIIKLIEDKMNLDQDVLQAGVQMILLVEDSIRHYSSILPNLYKFVLQQSLEFATEALNSQLEMLRMRGRPKIVLARNYEEAWALYNRYCTHTLGVISDCRFPREGKTDEQAGFRLLSKMREADPYLPLIMQSSETDKREYAQRCGASFIDKNSKNPADDLRQLVLRNFGFGDFIFRKPGTRHEEVRIRNLKDLQDNIFTLPQESLLYHIRHNNVSRWLGSRALFPISEFLRDITWDSLQDIDAHRQIIFDAIVRYRRMKNQGVVAVFNRHRFDRYSNFARIGDGSLGGKGRGLAFLDHIILRHPDLNDFPGSSVQLPKTVVLCTDLFDEFMEQSDLYPIALSDVPDEEILAAFLSATFPQRLREDLIAYLQVVNEPIAIRSSSLLEDAHYQPFAGIYSTYMIPPVADITQRLELLMNAIKAVYASVFYQDSKAYMAATRNVIDQEKMAVLLQEVVGSAYDGRYYPHISGVGRSLNYYPIGDEAPEDGIVNLALGLGKYIVDGGLSLRVCPAYPNKVLQTSEVDIALRETQTRFYALDTTTCPTNFQVDDGFNLLKLPVNEAVKDGAMRFTCSTYDPYDMVIRDGIYEGGRKVVTFSGVLQHGVFPLPELLQKLLRYGREEMRREVEVEFAVKLLPDRTGIFYPLQIRPMVAARLQLDEDLSLIPDEKALLHSHHAIGHGILSDIFDIIYVKTENFSASHNPAVADEIEQLNRRMVAEGRPYVLVGPGRWGSSDPWLGIPVKWPHISGAKVIVEAGLSNYRVDPSQGTHFFQNLTSFGVAYYTIDDYKGDGLYRYDYLAQQPAEKETSYLRLVHFDHPIVVKTDGINKEGVVLL
ncbi:MAG: PEP/pyruvate-binding domain-containing protein [Bacteroidales bacterium]|nr:PEP/pyruvate-binding domain-containing protein [Bacteroidales bacterium]